MADKSINLASLVVNAAEKHPNRIALKLEDDSVSYLEFDVLIKKYQAVIEDNIDVSQHGMCAAIVAFKSIEALAFSQAALRCGFYYTVIDPRYPEDRVNLILSDSQPEIIYSDQDRDYLCRIVPNSSRALLVTENRIEQIIPKQIDNTDVRRADPTSSSAVDIKSDALAFVLYTSGSTGIPKGVQITHSNAVYSINWGQDHLHFDCEDVFLNQAHMGFDFCVLDYYNAWNVGASIILVPEYMAIFASKVVELIKNEGVTNLWLVPSNVISLIERGGLFNLNSSQIRRFLYAGEPFPIKYLKAVFDWMGGDKVYNLYGPAETNLVSFHKVETPDFDYKDIPVGQPLPGTKVKLLLEDGGYSDLGKGELMVSSPSVFPGYSNRADLNCTKLMIIKGVIWYKTGDVCEIDSNGCIWFKGRTDSMIKVRGYRVELQEIEMSFSELDCVKQSVALAKRVCEGDSNEVYAFCVLKNSIDVDILKRHARQKLPAYMIPKEITIVDTIPFNNRGKIDKAKLLEMLQ